MPSAMNGETDFIARAAREPLAASDAWCQAVLESCRKQKYTPKAELCDMQPLTDPAYAAATLDGSVNGAYYPNPAGVKTEGEEQDALVDHGASQEVIDVESVTSAVAKAAALEPSRLSLPSNLMAKAYRLDAPCALPKHSNKSAATRANCEAAPTCMYGLQTLRSTKTAVADCAAFCMGRGPNVLPLPASMASAAVTTAAAAVAANPPSAEKPTSSRDTPVLVPEDSSSDEEASTATSTGEWAAETIPEGFPCLWRGLQNLGNTCYFNSVLQLLFATPAVRRAILKDGNANAAAPAASEAAVAGPDGPSAAAAHGETSGVVGLESATQLFQSGLKEVFAEMAFSRDGNGANPASFARFLSLDPALQQDAQEFLALLIDWLRCHCGPTVKAAMDTTFAGALLYDRRCSACGRSAKRAEPFLYLTVPVKPTLHESLADFMKPESVEGFACEGCGQKVTATSRQYLRTLPDVLIVHINRFEFDMRTLQRQKVLATTSFPLTLDMAPYEAQWTEVRKQEQQQQQQQQQQQEDKDAGAALSEEPQEGTTSSSPEVKQESPASTAPQPHLYELRGVLNHLGESATSGHYTYQGKVYRGAPSAGAGSTTQSTKSGSGKTKSKTATEEAMNDEESDENNVVWLNFNDAEVTKLNRFKGVHGQSKDAYVLVYHRVPAAAPPAPTEEASAPTTATTALTAKERNPPPVPAEFPPYLLRYVALLNNRCLEARRAWERNKEELISILTKWAQAAKALFEPQTDRLGGFAAALDSDGGVTQPEPVYVLPTAWLRLFGRAFLAPFVDVDRFGGDAADRKRTKEEEASAGAASARNPLDASPPPAGATDCADGEGEEEGSGHAGGAAHQRRSSLAGMGATAANGLLVNEDGTGFYRNVRRHNVRHFLDGIVCPHGRIAPWGAYKVVSKAAFYLVREFLLLCGAHDEVLSEDVPAQASRQKRSGAAGDAAGTASLLNLQAHTCPDCAAAAATAVEELSRSTHCDMATLLAMHEVSAESKSSGRDDASSTPTPATPAAPSLVYVSEDIVKIWEMYTASKGVWQGLSKTEGFTGVFVLQQNALNPPLATTPSKSAATEERATSAFSAAVMNAPMLGGAAAGSASPVAVATDADGALGSSTGAAEALGGVAPLSQPGRDLRRTWDNLVNVLGTVSNNLDTYVSGDVVDEEALRSAVAGRGMHASLVCEHGRLRPDAAVRAVPEAVRQYLLTRLPAIRAQVGALPGMPTAPFPSATTAGSSSDSGTAIDRVFQQVLECVLLPSIPCAETPRCEECVSLVEHHLTTRHRLQMERLQERKRFPTLSAAGKLTDPDVAQAMLMASTELDNEEQLITTQHPNRAFFKRNIDKQWRDHVKAWKETQSERITRQEAAIKDLKAAAEKQKASDEAWRAMTRQRRGGGGGGGAGAPRGAMSPTDPRHPAHQLALAEGFLAKMRVEEPPVLSTRYGCLPMWWVARWYRHVNGAAPTSAPAAAAGTSHHGDEEEELDAALSQLDYAPFVCPHGKLLVEMAWLNPADGFWQGTRIKRPEALWNGASAKSSQAWRPEDMRWTAWLPPLLVVPMEEFVEVVRRYGSPDMLETAIVSLPPPGVGKDKKDVHTVAAEKKEEDDNGSLEEGTRTTEEEEVARTKTVYNANPEKTVQVVETRGERALTPGACDMCCKSLVDSFEDNCAYFTNGAFPLQLHIRKSKKLYYDADGVLNSKALAAGGASNGGTEDKTAGGSQGGVHHFTTLQQLRVLLSEYIMNEHGFLVPADESLEVLRGRKPLKRKRQLPGSSGVAGGVATHGATKDTAVTVNDSDSASVSREPSPRGSPTNPQAGTSEDDTAKVSGGAPSPSSLADATLYELGINDGDTITVNYTAAPAPPCAKAKKPGEEEEVWEAIPEELLTAGPHTTGEHTVAFGQTRLQSAGGGAGPHAPGVAAAGQVVAEEAGVSCPVCTFLNAPGMVQCEMCESPLPAPPPRRRS